MLPLKCKLCSKTISPPIRIIGQSDAEYRGACTAKLTGHVAGHAKEEMKTGGPHAIANAQAAIPSQNLYSALLLGCFDLPPEMERDRAEVFAMIHALTRTVRMTDQDINAWAPSTVDSEGIAALRDLRDRYEGLGKYAPESANAPQPEEVKP